REAPERLAGVLGLARQRDRALPERPRRERREAIGAVGVQERPGRGPRAERGQVAQQRAQRREQRREILRLLERLGRLHARERVGAGHALEDRDELVARPQLAARIVRERRRQAAAGQRGLQLRGRAVEAALALQ